MPNKQQIINQPKTNKQNTQPTKPVIVDPKTEKLKEANYSVDKSGKKANDNLAPTPKRNA